MESLPLNIEKDNSIRIYKKLNENGEVVNYFEREVSPFDKLAVIKQGIIIDKPEYYGEWTDKTEDYLRKEAEKLQAKKEAQKLIREQRKILNEMINAKYNKNSANLPYRPATEDTNLLEAEELLKSLLEGGEINNCV